MASRSDFSAHSSWLWGCYIYKSVNDESRITEYYRRLLSLFKVSQCIKGGSHELWYYNIVGAYGLGLTIKTDHMNFGTTKSRVHMNLGL